MKPCETCGETNTEIVEGGNYEHSCHYSVCIQYVEKLELQNRVLTTLVKALEGHVDVTGERLISDTPAWYRDDDKRNTES